MLDLKVLEYIDQFLQNLKLNMVVDKLNNIKNLINNAIIETNKISVSLKRHRE